MNVYLNGFYSLSVGLAAIAAWVRFRSIPYRYHPFIWIIWIAFFTELLSINLILNKYSNALLYDLYSLAELLLISWQFYNWGLFRSRTFYLILQAVFVVWWPVEKFLLPSGLLFNSYFLMAYSFTIVFMSLTLMARLLFIETGRLYRNATFLICLGMSVFFTYAVVVEAFWKLGFDEKVLHRLHTYQILCYINLFTNTLYALAILWIPRKKRSILQS